MTFCVDKIYKIIEFFEGWIDWISGVGDNPGGILHIKILRLDLEIIFLIHIRQTYMSISLKRFT